MHLVDPGPRASRSFSLPSIDRQRPRLRAASVLGTLGLAPGRHSGAYKYYTLSVEEMMKSENDHTKEVVLPVQEAAKRKVKPRTPTLTPPNEPEVINAWSSWPGSRMMY